MARKRARFIRRRMRASSIVLLLTWQRLNWRWLRRRRICGMRRIFRLPSKHVRVAATINGVGGRVQWSCRYAFRPSVICHFHARPSALSPLLLMRALLARLISPAVAEGRSTRGQCRESVLVVSR